MTLTPGRRIGPYEVLSAIGAGGMGEVYRARDPRLGRDVALKLLPPEFSRDADRVRRFRQEARAASSLHHPNIVTIYDVGDIDGVPYLVAELLEGQSLRVLLSQGPLPWRRAVELAAQLALGLATAHEQGVIHRDLKPDNLFITSRGDLKILDFGLAKVEGEAPSDGTLTDTSPGAVLGTAGYMAPEQVRGHSADHRADIFAFGAILYEMISGRRAFPGESAIDRAMAILRDEPQEPEADDPRFPPALWRIVRRCLAKSPRERIQMARDLSAFLDAIAAPTDSVRPLTDVSTPPPLPTQRSKRPLAAMAMVVLVALAGGALLALPLARNREQATAAQANAGAPPLEAGSRSPGPHFQQITFQQGAVARARFGPDGQSVVYSAKWTGSPERQVFSAFPGAPESRPLLEPGIHLLAVSRQGELLVGIPGLKGTSKLVARVPIGGGAPRPIADDAVDADFSRDGGALMLLRVREGKFSLELPLGTPVYDSLHELTHARLSPDQKKVAFLEHPVMDDDLGYVMVLDVAKGTAERLGPRWASAKGLAWSPDGREIFFTAAESGMIRGLRAVDLAGNVRELLRVPANLILHDVANDGRLLVSRDDSHAVVELLERETGKVRDLTWFDWTFPTQLSEDGASLLFLESGQAASPRYLAYLRPANGGAAVRLGEGIGTALSPDGQWVLFLPGTQRDRLLVLPTGPGQPRPIEPGPIVQYARVLWLNDGKSILFSGLEAQHELRLYVQELDGSPPKAISPERIFLPRAGGDPISPDRRWVVAKDARQTPILYPLTGGEPRPIPGATAHDQLVGWSADGGSLFGIACCREPWVVERLDLTTGERKPELTLVPAQATGMIDGVGQAMMTRDAKSVLYHYHRMLSEVFVLEGLK